MKSKKYSMSKEDVQSIAIHAGILVASTLITYFSEVIVNVDFGQYSPIIVIALSTLLKTIQKYLAGR